MTATSISRPNGGTWPLREIPAHNMESFRGKLAGAVSGGARLSALFGSPEGEAGIRLVAVLAKDREGLLGVMSTLVGESYPALTPDCEQAHLFEREIAEQWGVRPEGHPWLKPVRFHGPYLRDRDSWGSSRGSPAAPGVMNFFKVEGEEVHEVAVGPVHAGIIEPGHFRFQCHGERVLHLEISLGYQHRGVERALAGGPDKRSVHYLETLAGDTSVGHALAYAQVLEALSGVEAPPRAQALRGVALELERLANHAGDLGALAGDVGYLPAAAYCGRLRGEFLNLTTLACGSRLGRGWIRPGGVAFDLDAEQGSRILQAAGERSPGPGAGGGASLEHLDRARPLRGDRHALRGELRKARLRRPGGEGLRRSSGRAPRFRQWNLSESRDAGCHVSERRRLR